LLANLVLIFRFQLLAVYVLLVHNCGQCRIVLISAVILEDASFVYLAFTKLGFFFLFISDLRDEFRILPKDTDVSLGEDTILKCSPPKGHPSPVVKWKKDGEYLDLTSSKR
jgi:hypothetical protein